MLFYLCRYTVKPLLTEISVHTGNICSDVQGAWTSPYALNVRTNISQYGPQAWLIRAYSLLRIIMAHSAVWGYVPIQRQNKSSEKLSENGLSSNAKFCSGSFERLRQKLGIH